VIAACRRIIYLARPALTHGTGNTKPRRAHEKSGLTSKALVFAGGDAVTGAATVILAAGAGKRAAQAMHEALAPSGN
jgi:NADPH-dependent glutamate synthase beta subunit-like oxidoreductase